MTSPLVLISEDSRGIDAGPVASLTESVNGHKRTFIEGIFAQSEVVNKNRRMYPQKVLFEATGDYIRSAVSRRNASALGELNHPEYPKPNAKEACHVITELRFEGNDVIGKAEVLEELPNGKIVKSLLDRNIEIGVSTRGIGAVSEAHGGVSKVNRYKMFAVDVVTDPSAPAAFVKGLMEGVEWAHSEGQVDDLDLETAFKIVRADECDRVALLSQFLSGFTRLDT